MEIGKTLEKQAYLIDGKNELQAEWFEGIETVLITAGASAPEIVVQEVVDHLVSKYSAKIREEVLREENVNFPLPKELRILQASQ
jgi:4-hydroxy-3-methylbut-2-enyl diphosphate reductase